MPGFGAAARDFLAAALGQVAKAYDPEQTRHEGGRWAGVEIKNIGDSYNAYVNGAHAARADVGSDGTDRHLAAMHVHQNFQGIGLEAKLRAHIEQRLGAKLMPAPGATIMKTEIQKAADEFMSVVLSECGFVAPPQCDDFAITVPIVKVDDEKRLVYGWALVTDVAGVPVLDHQDDIVEVEDLRKSVHAFLSSDRTAGIIHAKDGNGEPIRVGEIVESMVVSPDIEAALGVEFGKSGWLIGMHVEADSVWADVKSGKLPAFSIGGTGQRVEIAA